MTEAAMAQRESRYVQMAKIAYRLARETQPLYSHPKSPHRFTRPQLVACVLLMFYLKLSYRDMEEWLLATDKVCQALELKRVPDHSTLSRAYKRLPKADLEHMNHALLGQLGIEEEIISVDSTGFTQSQASAYYETRRGTTARRWIRAGYVVGTSSQLILGFQAGLGPSNDIDMLPGLRRQARRYGRRVRGQRAWLLVGDMGFDGRTLEAGDIVPPVRRGGAIVAPDRLERLELVSAARLDGIYGQRWKSETVHSVIKRKMGDTIRSRLLRLKKREPLAKAVMYNIHR
jgi:hypothetical protein